MVCDFEIIDNTVRVNCLGCVYGSSIEDFEACMAKTIDKLMEVKNAERIILAETRETEYDYEQTKMLMEIAKAYNRILNEDKLLSLSKLGPKECEKFFPRRLAELQFLILEALRKDPVGAYFKLNRMITRVKLRAEKAPPKMKKCFTYYLENALIPIERIISSCILIKKARPLMKGYKPGDRKIYREIFHPLIRPNFMLTRFMALPPTKGRAVDVYTVAKNISVEIFRVPGKVRYIYHITPPEFRLSEKKYSILDSARRYLAAHRPTEAEFTEPEKTRETFTNIGRDLIKEVAKGMGVSLTAKEIEELAVILARYTAGFGVLEILLADEKIQDIFVNSPIGLTPIFVQHSDFEECETNLIPTREDAEAWATRFRMYSGRPLDEANPVLDTELTVPGGRARVCAITRTLSPEGLAYSFRRHRERPWTFPLFIKVKMFDPLYAGLLSFLIDGGRCILVAGGRASGKTSLLGAMILEVMKKFRIIIQEDTPELAVSLMRKIGYNIEGLKSRSVITRVEAELPAEEALRTAIRLGDACLIVGEVRSSLRGDQEIFIVENGVTRRVPISYVENMDRKNALVPTLDTKKEFKVKLSKLDAFIKHPKRKRFIRIKTRSGREVIVTPEHSVFTLNSLKIVPHEAEKLKIGDKIIIPSKIPCAFNDIEFFDLTKILHDFRLENYERYLREVINVLGSKRASEICGVAEIYMYLTKKKYKFKNGVVARIKAENFLKLMKEANINFSLDTIKIKKVTSNTLPAKLAVNEDFCRFLGYFISEGHIEGTNVVISNVDKRVIKDVVEISRKSFGHTPSLREGKTSLGKSIKIIIGNSPLAHFLKRLKIHKKSYEKRIPDFIFGLSIEKICAFLSGLYSGDGSFNGIRVEYSTTSKALASDLLYLLLTLGIVGRVRERKQAIKAKGKRRLYSVEFARKEDVTSFLEKVRFTGKKLLQRKVGLEISRYNVIDFSLKDLFENVKNLPLRYNHLKRFLRASKFYLRQALKTKQFVCTDYFKKFVNGDFYIDEIKEVEEIKLPESEYVYDLSVNPTENFVGGFGGILLHNTEATALFEAMRIGALSNLVAGTIHAESAYGVFDRVVNDLGVVPTSFKAADIITICSMLRSPDGLHRFRRVTELTELRKHWKTDPLDEGGFVPLMEYSAREDRLKPTDTLVDGESEIINEIAKRVREWHGRWDAVWDNILLRAKIKEAMVDYAKRLDNPEILEADFVSESNETFHLICDDVRQELGGLDSKMIYEKWSGWLKKRIKG